MAKSASESRRRIISKRTKFAFATGSLEEAAVGVASITTMIFYNQVLGVSPAICGVAFLIASIVDAVSDPLVGALSDSVRSRWGRRHPFMFGAAVPLGIFFYLLYQPPEGMGEGGLFWWLTLTMVGLRIAKTFYSVPHSALGAELTDDYDERTSVFAWNWIFLMVGQVALTTLMMYVIFPTPADNSNGLLVADRYPDLALYGGAFCFAMIMVCTLWTSDQIPYLHLQERLGERIRTRYEKLIEAWVNIKAMLVNPSYIAVVACWMLLASLGGVVAVASTYTFIYAFDFTTEQIALRAYVQLPGALMCVAVSAYLTRWLDKKYTVIVTIGWTAFLTGLPFCLRMLGWFPENDSVWMLPLFFGIWGIAYITYPVIPTVIDSQLVDVADEHELKTGNRAEGLIMSIRTFAIKATGGIGSIIAGFWLEFIDFPEKASAETLTPEHIDGLLFMMGPLYWIMIYIGLGFAFMYRINKTRHAEILEQLEARRASRDGDLTTLASATPTDGDRT